MFEHTVRILYVLLSYRLAVKSTGAKIKKPANQKGRLNFIKNQVNGLPGQVYL